MKRIFTLGLIMGLVPGTGFGDQATIDRLIAQKQEKMEKLEKCQGTTKKLKIAGISTLGVTAVGVGANIAEAVVLNDYKDKVKTATAERDKEQKIKEDREAKAAAAAEAAKNNANNANMSFAQWCAGNGGTITDNVNCVINYNTNNAAYEDLLNVINNIKNSMPCSNDAYDKTTQKRNFSCVNKTYNGNVIFNFDFSTVKCRGGEVNIENNTCGNGGQTQVQEQNLQHNIDKILSVSDVYDEIDNWFDANNVPCEGKNIESFTANSAVVSCGNIKHNFTFKTQEQTCDEKYAKESKERKLCCYAGDKADWVNNACVCKDGATWSKGECISKNTSLCEQIGGTKEGNFCVYKKTVKIKDGEEDLIEFLEKYDVEVSPNTDNTFFITKDGKSAVVKFSKIKCGANAEYDETTKTCDKKEADKKEQKEQKKTPQKTKAQKKPENKGPVKCNEEKWFEYIFCSNIKTQEDCKQLSGYTWDFKQVELDAVIGNHEGCFKDGYGPKDSSGPQQWQCKNTEEDMNEQYIICNSADNEEDCKKYKGFTWQEVPIGRTFGFLSYYGTSWLNSTKSVLGIGTPEENNAYTMEYRCVKRK